MSFGLTTKPQWEGEGWKCVSPNTNIASLLLGQPNDETNLSSYVNMDEFQKKGHFRVIGQWNDQKESKTYECISEFPSFIFSTKGVSNNWDFPLKPPSDAFQPYCFKYKEQQIAAWTQPSNGNSDYRHKELFSSQGFTENQWFKHGRETVYILNKNAIELLAIILREDKKTEISLMKLNRT